MTLLAVRSHLSIGLALIASILGAYAYITNLHYQNLETRYEALEKEKAAVLVANANLATTVSNLSSQRIIDNKVYNALQAQLSLIKGQGEFARNQFRELAKNDKVLLEFNQSIVPPSAMRVLYEQAKGASIRYEDGSNSSSGVFAPALSSPIAESSGSGNQWGRTFKLYEFTN